MGPCINESSDLQVISQFLLSLSTVTAQSPPPPSPPSPPPLRLGQPQAQAQAQVQGQAQPQAPPKSDPDAPAHVAAAEPWTSLTGDSCRRWQVELRAAETGISPVASSDAGGAGSHAKNGPRNGSHAREDSKNGVNARNDANSSKQERHAPVIAVLQFDDVSSDSGENSNVGEQMMGKRERERDRSLLGGPRSFASVDGRREGWPGDERMVAASAAVMEAMHVKMTFWKVEREEGGREGEGGGGEGGVGGAQGRMHSAVPSSVREGERHGRERERVGEKEPTGTARQGAVHASVQGGADTSAGASGHVSVGVGVRVRVCGAAESTWRSIRQQWATGPLMARVREGGSEGGRGVGRKCLHNLSLTRTERFPPGA